MRLTRFDLAATEGENLKQGSRLLHLPLAVDILHDHPGFTVLDDDQGFTPVSKRANDLGSVSLEVTDGLTWLDSFVGRPSFRLNIVHKQV